MAENDQRVVVLGAASWIGQHVCRLLRGDGWSVTAVSRGKSAFLLDRLGVRVCAAEELRAGERFPVVVNLAFPVDVGGREPHTVNGEIFERVRALAEPGARILHFSTLAVFGLALDQPIGARPLASRRDYEYVELKLEMEQRLAGAFAGQELHLLRLGNVWGPGSANWVVGLANRLRTGLPVGVEGQDGFSNVTDVANVADYARCLLRTPRGPGTHFHHLAEFGGEPWSRFVGFLAESLGADPTRVEELPPQLPSLKAEFRRRTIEGINGLRQAWWDGRFTGSVYRSARRRIPDFVRHARPGRAEEIVARPSFDPPLSQGDLHLLRILACPVRFESVTAAGWRAPVDLAESLARVSSWLKQAGYAA